MSNEPKGKQEVIDEPKPGAAMTPQDIASLIAQSIAAAMSSSQPATKKLVGINDWPKRQIPDRVQPGYAVVSDQFGNNPKLVEIYMLCSGSSGAVRVLPIEGRIRGEVIPGALLDAVRKGYLVPVQWAPYPEFRDDGQPHVKFGALAYPPSNPQHYDKVDGVLYHKQLGRDMRERAAKGA